PDSVHVRRAAMANKKKSDKNDFEGEEPFAPEPLEPILPPEPATPLEPPPPPEQKGAPSVGAPIKLSDKERDALIKEKEAELNRLRQPTPIEYPRYLYKGTKASYESRVVNTE